MLGMAFPSRGSRPWSWKQVRNRTLAIYRSQQDGRSRLAVLLWQADDPQVDLAGASPPLVVFTMDVEAEPGEDNAVALAGFESLEQARAYCIEWTGGTAEVSWDDLGETAQIGIYASIREPSFADRG